MQKINHHHFFLPLLLGTYLVLGAGSIATVQAQSTTTPAASAESSAPGSAVSNQSNKNNGDSLAWLWWVVGAIHLLEILGIVLLVLTIRDMRKQNQERSRQVAEKITTLDTGLKSQLSGIQKLDAGLVTLKTAVSQELHQNTSAAQPMANQAMPAQANSTRPEAAAGDLSFLDLYRQNIDAFKNQYLPTAASEDQENLQKRWSGERQDIILGADRQGNYWLLPVADRIYLLPSPKLKINDMNMRTAGGLFECHNYRPAYQTMKLVQPAIVSIQAGGADPRWKLEQKGVLEFT
jgi:hypothetical protein